jgi:hypothetical protein
MFTNQLFLELEVIHVYGASLLASAVGSATILCQTRGLDSINGKLQEIDSINRKLQEIERDVKRIARKLDLISGDMFASVRETAAAMASNHLRGVNSLYAKMRCQQSGGKGCR